MKNIPGFEGRYGITKEGKIWSYRREKWLKTPCDDMGYSQTALDRGLHTRVHRLVAKTFLLNPHGLLQINHKNGIKTDNRVENLEWCSAKENAIHARKHGLIGPNHGSRNGSARIKEKDVIELRQLYKV